MYQNNLKILIQSKKKYKIIFFKIFLKCKTTSIAFRFNVKIKDGGISTL